MDKKNNISTVENVKGLKEEKTMTTFETFAKMRELINELDYLISSENISLEQYGTVLKSMGAYSDVCVLNQLRGRFIKSSANNDIPSSEWEYNPYENVRKIIRLMNEIEKHGDLDEIDRDDNFEKHYMDYLWEQLACEDIGLYSEMKHKLDIRYSNYQEKDSHKESDYRERLSEEELTDMCEFIKENCIGLTKKQTVKKLKERFNLNLNTSTWRRFVETTSYGSISLNYFKYNRDADKIEEV